MTRIRGDSRHAASAFNPTRRKLNVVRIACSANATTETSTARPNARGSRYVEHSVLVETVSAVGRLLERVALRAEAGARAEVDGPVLPAEIAATDLEEPARCELDALLPQAVRAQNRPRIRLEASANADRRRIRFVHGHDEIGPVRAVRHLQDLHAPEESQRDQPATAVEQTAVAERIARLQAQLVADGFFAGAAVADDEDVIDANDGSFSDLENQVEEVRSSEKIGTTWIDVSW